MTKTERKEMRDACSELFREPTTEKLSTLLRTMLRQSVTRMPVGVDEFANEPTEERLNKLNATLRKFRQQTDPLETLCRTFYTFQKEPSRRNADSLLAVLPSLDTSGRNAVALAVFLSHPSVEHSLNFRLELTMKQRYATELSKKPTMEERFLLNEVLRTSRKPTNAALPRLRKRSANSDTPPSLRERFEQELKTRTRQMTPYSASVRLTRHSAPPTVNVPQRRLSLVDAPLFAPYLYLTEDDTRRIAIRLMNRLNKELFGHAARRKHDPQRLTALVCQHDRGTRRHLHVLLAQPPDVTLPAFRNALTRSCRTEPFIYRSTRLEQVNSLAGSIRYNADDFKTLSQNSILYIHTNTPSQKRPRTENSNNEPEPTELASTDRAAADDGDRVFAPHAG